MFPIFLFEIRYRLRQVSTYLYFVLLFTLTFLAVATDVVKSAGGSNVMINSPLVISNVTMGLTAFGALILCALAGTAVYRDFECGAYELFFTSRITKRSYYVGRFLGAYAVSLLVFSGILWGLLAGTWMPWVDHTKLAPFHPQAYLQAFCVFLMPNLLFVSALFFTLGALTRNLLAIYAQGIALLVGYLLAIGGLSSLGKRWPAALLDPFALTPTRLMTEYWTVSEKNRLLIPLEGYLLWNRVLWVGAGLAVFLVGYHLFTFAARPRALGRGRRSESDAPSIAPALGPPPAVQLRYDLPTTAKQCVRLTTSYLIGMVRSVPFLLIALSGLLLLCVDLVGADRLFETAIYPVTRVIVKTIDDDFIVFFLILLTFYSGELVWKERVVKLDQIHDALPLSTELTLLSKIAAVVVMQVLLLIALALAGIASQLVRGYAHLEPGLYITFLFGTVLPPLINLTVMAFFIHTVVNQKFLGHTLTIVFYLATWALSAHGYEHHLYIYAGSPSITYSDMNRYGPFVAPVFWFSLYWLTFAALLVIGAVLFSVRGMATPLRGRLRIAAARWQGKIGLRALTFSLLLALAGQGSYLFYNTNVLNEYHTEKGGQRIEADYERKYRKYLAEPMPRITDVQLQVDLYPQERRYAIAGTYRLKNKTDRPIPLIAINASSSLTVHSLVFDRPGTRTLSDNDLGFYVYRLDTPLAPGETTTLRFDVAYEKRGFPNDHPNTSIAENGAFLEGVIPNIGYLEAAELKGEEARKQQGLPPRPRMATLEDTAARRNTYIGADADWITFDATLSTSPDQIAITSGRLQREWTEKGRRYFHYVADAPIRNFYAFLSARYVVRRDRWKDVAIEVYYHPDHAYNVARMIKSVQRSLDYYTTNFGPYQFKQLRIVEFPCYQDLAQSFPNTIPYSEGIGFIARVKDSEDTDYPFYVTAHETAHQWWAHQVLGADVEGSEMLSESFAEYSALMVMKKEYGEGKVSNILWYDLDQYLKGRGEETQAEQPLMRVQHQSYIYYDKGSLSLYALQDYLGEKKLNAVLARFLHDKAYQEPPYTTSAEFVQYLRQATPPSLQYLITDMFEKITLYDNSVQSVTYARLPSGKYRVRLKVAVKKIYADGKGNESPAPLHDLIEIAVYGKPPPGYSIGYPLLQKKCLISGRLTTFVFTVNEKPYSAGIDPNNLLIDRRTEDHYLTARPDAP